MRGAQRVLGADPFAGVQASAPRVPVAHCAPLHLRALGPAREALPWQRGAGMLEAERAAWLVPLCGGAAVRSPRSRPHPASLAGTPGRREKGVGWQGRGRREEGPGEGQGWGARACQTLPH